MRVVHHRCGGIEIHPKVVVATIIITHNNANIQKKRRAFSTMIADLLALDSWLEENQIGIVAMKSTARMDWSLIADVLGIGRTVVHANMRRLEAIPALHPGNVVVKDSEWLATMLRHGLLPVTRRSSQQVSEICELLRYRKTLAQGRDREIHHLRNVLEVILAKAATQAATTANIVNVNRHTIGILPGEQDPMRLSNLISDQLHEKIPELKQQLTVQMQPHYQSLLYHMLKHIDFLEEALAALQIEIENWIPVTASKKIVELEGGRAMKNALHTSCREVRPL